MNPSKNNKICRVKILHLHSRLRIRCKQPNVIYSNMINHKGMTLCYVFSINQITRLHKRLSNCFMRNKMSVRKRMLTTISYNIIVITLYIIHPAIYDIKYIMLSVQRIIYFWYEIQQIKQLTTDHRFRRLKLVIPP